MHYLKIQMNRYGKTSFLQLREDAFESLEVVRQSAAEATGTSAASFQDRYLISGWFMGSHLNQGIWGLGVQPVRFRGPDRTPRVYAFSLSLAA